MNGKSWTFLIVVVFMLLSLVSCGQGRLTTIEARLYKCRIEGKESDSYFGLKEGETAYLVYRKRENADGTSSDELFVIRNYSEKEKKMMDQAPNGSLLKLTLPPDVEPVILPAIYPYSIKLIKKEAPVIDQEALDTMTARGWSYPVIGLSSEEK